MGDGRKSAFIIGLTSGLCNSLDYRLRREKSVGAYSVQRYLFIYLFMELSHMTLLGGVC